MILLLFLLIPPLKPPLAVTSGFGSYRLGHFHAGVDFSTGMKTGRPLYAVSRGKIVRIRASHKGYGKALYLQLDNGDLILYAHLERFTRSLERRLRQYQRRRKKYRADIIFDPPIPVKEGAVVGFSGASGTGPPHLHLEWRTKEGLSINPLKRLEISDRMNLRVERLILSSSLRFPQEKEIELGMNSDTVEIHAPFKVFAKIGERLENGRVRSGIPELVLLELDQDTVFLMNFLRVDPRGLLGEAVYSKENFSTSLSLFRPTFLYWEQLRGLTHLNPEPGIHRLTLKLDEEEASFFLRVLGPSSSKPEVLYWDWEPKGMHLRFFDKGLLVMGSGLEVFVENYGVKPVYEEGDTEFFWLKGSGTWKILGSTESLFLQSFWIKDSLILESSKKTEVPIGLKVKKGDIAEPLLLWRVALRDPDPKEGLVPDGGFVAYFPKDPLLINPIEINAEHRGERTGIFKKNPWGWSFVGKRKGLVWELGEFGLLRDTIAPRILVKRLKKNLLSLTVWDKGSGIDVEGISAYLDNRWIPMAYDPDDGSLRYDPLTPLPRGRHLLAISVKDRLGNKAHLKRRFYVR